VTQAELLRYLVEVLDGLGLPYMVGGSHAAMYYGEPRLTRDVDIVVALTLDRLPNLLHRFPAAHFYVDAEAARDAVETSGQFNIIHPDSGLKIDVYVNPDTPYDRARLARRHRLPLAPGVDAYFARPEDVILYKLIYARDGGELHLRDVIGIVRVSGPDLDERYLVEWADLLGVRALWERVRRQAG
jgi:hypothetical protein